ncbi:MAG: phosphopantothenoylcysteine decarboxylase [Planctomycetota bacterium]
MSRRVLITAGPTREPIDAVRYLSNRSSGTMGVALANAADASAHATTLLLGPVDSSAAERVHAGVRIERFETTADLAALLREHFRACDVLVMAAAVSDYRVTEADAETGKRERKDELTLILEATPDLVAGCTEIKRPDQRVVSFALEQADQLEDRAIMKMRRKGVDATVANPLETMDADEIDAVWLTADGDRRALGPMDKAAFAAWLIERVTAM